MNDLSTIPTWPRIEAQTRPDGSGELTINGTSYPIETASPQAARNEIIRRVTDTAAKIGRPVRVATAGPDGNWPIIVHPDGTIEADPTPQEPPAGRGRRDRLDTQQVVPLRPAPADGPAPRLAAGPRDQTDDSDEAPGKPAAKAGAAATPAAPEVTPASSPPPAAAAAWPPAAGQSYAAPAAPPRVLPTLDDLLQSRPAPPPGPAEWGWQGTVRRLTFGLISPRPGPEELTHRVDVASVQRSLSGPRTIVVVNPKGGAHKTTATMLIAATFGLHRGGYTLAWDNNETRGTLGWRALPSQHTNTAVNLLADLDRFDDAARSRVGDLDNYVRSQGSAQFDVLASDEDAAASANIDSRAFDRLHAALSRFYRIIVVDTGNNMRASNWGAALAAADQLVIVSTIREDTAASAAWLVDGLRSRLYEEKVEQAVTLLSSPAAEPPDPQLQRRLHTHFGQLTRAVLDVPYDPALVDGAPISVDRLRPATREAWLHATAVIADGLGPAPKR